MTEQGVRLPAFGEDLAAEVDVQDVTEDEALGTSLRKQILLSLQTRRK